MGERIIGSYDTGLPGRTFLGVGGLHGNEPAGGLALSRVLHTLREQSIPVRGRIVALSGHLEAQASKVRFIDEDLNRLWTPERVARIVGGKITTAEEREARELLSAFEDVFEKAEDEVIFMDLHTTSADGDPFTFVGDTLRNRELARDFPVPVIFGLEEQLDGGLTEYLGNRGCRTIGFEGGQHDDPIAVDYNEAAIWIVLTTAGIVSRDRVPRYQELVDKLRGATMGKPPVLEIRYRYPIGVREDFEMLPGFRNFQRVKRDQLLARDRGSDVRAEETGRILLPLYQALGADGFFISRPFNGFWLSVSALLRKLHFDKWITRFPGIGSEPDSDYVRVDPNIARWYVIEIFHLLGFRKHRPHDGVLILSRRKYDLKAPSRVEPLTGELH